MARKIKFKTNWKKILSAILAVIVCITVIGGIAALAKSDSKSISSTAFSHGALDENGKYVKTDRSIYTEEAFGCIGLRVAPDFESNATYDVFYYDYDDRLLEAKEGLTGVYDEDYPLAKKARIVIHPEIPDDVDEDDYKIAFYDVYSIARKFEITVDKKQDYKYSNCENLFKLENVVNGQTFFVNGPTEYVEYAENENLKTSGEIAITGDFEFYDVYIRRPSQSDIFAVSVIAANEDDKVLAHQSYDLTDLNAGEWCKMTLEVPETDAEMYLVARMPKDADCYIFGYND